MKGTYREMQSQALCFTACPMLSLINLLLRGYPVSLSEVPNANTGQPGQVVVPGQSSPFRTLQPPLLCSIQSFHFLVQQSVVFSQIRQGPITSLHQSCMRNIMDDFRARRPFFSSQECCSNDCILLIQPLPRSTIVFVPNTYVQISKHSGHLLTQCNHGSTEKSYKVVKRIPDSPIADFDCDIG